MNLPTQMQHVELTAYGAPEVMRIVNGPLPVCGNDDVLIAVAAAGVNRPDVLQREGNYPPPPGASPILGLEVAGEIVQVGANVKTFSVGDRVCALTNGGGYADYAVAPAGQCLPVPEGLSYTQAAALPETFFTVWSNVFDRAALQPGETLLVHGGSSGIGAAAIQMAKAYGSNVIVTAGSQAKCDYCSALGADTAINYRDDDFVNVCAAVTAGKGVDVILDMVGGDYVNRNIKAAAVDGRIVNIAFLQGPKVSVNLLPVMLKRLVLTGSTLRPRDDAFKANIAQQLQKVVWPWLAQGKIKSCVEKVFSLRDVAAAHQWLEQPDTMGKVVLQTDHS